MEKKKALFTNNGINRVNGSKRIKTKEERKSREERFNEKQDKKYKSKKVLSDVIKESSSKDETKIELADLDKYNKYIDRIPLFTPASEVPVEPSGRYLATTDVAINCSNSIALYKSDDIGKGQLVVCEFIDKTHLNTKITTNDGRCAIVFDHLLTKFSF